MKLELASRWVGGVKLMDNECPFCGKAFVLIADKAGEYIHSFICPHVSAYDDSTVTFTGFVVGYPVAVVQDGMCRIGRFVSAQPETMTVSFLERWGAISNIDFPREQVYPVKEGK